MSVFKWGILGTGLVARKFVLGLQHLEGTSATVVASRSKDNAKRFAATMSIPIVADSYEAAIREANVDAFYIATPPISHCSLGLLCVETRRPVLIEKPLAATFEDASKLVQAAKEHSVFCMEGAWTCYLPAISKIKAILASGRIGEVKIFKAQFCSSEVPNEARSVFQRHNAGGALLHRGFYPLSLAQLFFGQPISVSSEVVFGDSSVDEQTGILLRHESGVMSVLHCSLRSVSDSSFEISGTQGRIQILGPIYRPFGLVIETTKPRDNVRYGGGSLRMERLKESGPLQLLQQFSYPFLEFLRRRSTSYLPAYYRGNGYNYEASELMNCVRAGLTESPIVPLSHSLNVLKTMDLIFRHSL
jgi:predicted dehydrogenase